MPKFKKDGSKFFYSTPKNKKKGTENNKQTSRDAAQSTAAPSQHSSSASNASSAPPVVTPSAVTTLVALSSPTNQQHTDPHRRPGPNQNGTDPNSGNSHAPQYPISVMESHPRHGNKQFPRSTHVRTVEGSDHMPFVPLESGTNLNFAPPNYLLPDFRYGVHRAAQSFERNADVAIGSLLATGVRHDLPNLSAAAAKGGPQNQEAEGKGSTSAAGGSSNDDVALPRVMTGGDSLKKLFHASLDVSNRDDFAKQQMDRAAEEERQSREAAVLEEEDGVLTPLARGGGKRDWAATPGDDYDQQQQQQPLYPPALLEDNLTLQVHRIGPSLVINAPKDGAAPASVADTRNRALYTKALYATEHEAVTAQRAKEAAAQPEASTSHVPSAESQQVAMFNPEESLARQQYQRGSLPTATDNMGGLVARVGQSALRKSYDPALHKYSHIIQCAMDDLNILMGVDTPILSNKNTGQDMTLAIHEEGFTDDGIFHTGRNGESQMRDDGPPKATDLTSREALDAWFDATLANVPQIAVLVHTRGVVREYDVKNVNSVLGAVDGRKAAAALSYTSHVLHWLLNNCTKDGGNYIVIRNPETLELELYDVSDQNEVAGHTSLPNAATTSGNDNNDMYQKQLEGEAEGSTRNNKADAKTLETDGGKAQLHHSVAMLCYKMAVHLIGQIQTCPNAGNSNHGSFDSAPGTPLSESADHDASGATGASGKKYGNSRLNKILDAVSLMQRSFTLFIQEEELCERKAESDELCLKLLEPALHITEELPAMISQLIAGKMYALHRSHFGGAEKGATCGENLCGTIEEHDVDTTVHVPSLYGEAMDIVAEMAHMVLPLITRLIHSASTIAVEDPKADLKRKVASVASKMLVNCGKALTSVLCRVTDRHRKILMDREIRYFTEVDRMKPSRGFERRNKESFSNLQKDIMKALVDVGCAGMRTYQEICDALVMLLDNERAIILGPAHARAGSSASSSPVQPGTPIATSTAPAHDGEGNVTTSLVASKDAAALQQRLVSRADVVALHASLAEYTGDCIVIAMLDTSMTSTKRYREVCRTYHEMEEMPSIAPKKSGANPPPMAETVGRLRQTSFTTFPHPRPKVMAGFADCGSITTLALLDTDLVANNHAAMRYFRMTKSTSRRVLQKLAEVQKKIGHFYSMTDRHTKALEHLKAAKDMLTSAGHAPEGKKFGTYSQENVSGVCGLALEIKIADVYVRKARASHNSNMMVKEMQRKKAANKKGTSAAEKKDQQQKKNIELPLIEASWSNDRLVPLSSEEESNWKIAIDIYRGIVSLTSATTTGCDREDETDDVMSMFAGKFRGLLAEALLHLGCRMIDTLAAQVLKGEESGKPALLEPDQLRDAREIFADVYGLLPACNLKSLRLAYEELRLFTIGLRSAHGVIVKGGKLTPKQQERVSAWKKIGKRCQDRLGLMLSSVNQGCTEGQCPNMPTNDCCNEFCEPTCGVQKSTCTAASDTEEEDCQSIGTSSTMEDVQQLTEEQQAMLRQDDPSTRAYDADGNPLNLVEATLRDYQGERISNYGGGGEPFRLPGVDVKVGRYYAEKLLHNAFLVPLGQLHHQLALFWFSALRNQAALEAASTAPINRFSIESIRDHLSQCITYCKHGLGVILIAPQKESPSYQYHAVALEQLTRNALLTGLRVLPKGSPGAEAWSSSLASLLHVAADYPERTACRLQALINVCDAALYSASPCRESETCGPCCA